MLSETRSSIGRDAEVAVARFFVARRFVND